MNQTKNDTAQGKLDGLIARVEGSELSSIKNIVSCVIDIINNPDSSAKDLVDLILVDPLLSAKILRVANSAHYASRRSINDIQQAIVWIGFNALKEIVLTQKVSEIFNNAEVFEGYSRELLWKHSLAVALVAKSIYQILFREKGENAYAAGLLHDIGIIVEDQLINEDFRKILHDCKRQKKALVNQENDYLGFNHSDIGGGLAVDWDFPEELCYAIGNHHNRRIDHPKFSRMAITLYMADFLVIENHYGFSSVPPQKGRVAFECYADDLKILPITLFKLMSKIRTNMAKREASGIWSTSDEILAEDELV